MNSVNWLMSMIFDVVMTPFELLGTETGLILVSGIIGILFLIVFKYISWQGGIKAVKDKIKGNMIAIRIYQDDLVVVFKSVVSVLLRNFQYLALNFGPVLLLMPLFVLALAQFVVRYAYDPLEVVSEARAEAMMPGEGTMLEVQLTRGFESDATAMSIELPEGLQAISPLVRIASEGQLFVEVAALKSLKGELQIRKGDRVVATKEIVAGDERTRLMQPRRDSSFWWSWLLPAEDALDASGPVAKIEFKYPDRQLAIPYIAGEFGILVLFGIVSMLFAIAVIKPLKVSI